MAVIFVHIAVAVLALGAFSAVLAVSPPLTVQCGQCPPNEVLRQSPPSCEPTCYEDCSSNSAPRSLLIYKPTCVCKPGYVRDDGVCIPREQCYEDSDDCDPAGSLVCAPNEDLLQSPPCCEPTCTNDCSTAVCPLIFIDQPTCVCKAGLVRYNGVCINPVQCSALVAPSPIAPFPPVAPCNAIPIDVPIAPPIVIATPAPPAPPANVDVSYIDQPTGGCGCQAGATPAPCGCAIQPTAAPPVCPCQQPVTAASLCQQGTASPCQPPPPLGIQRTPCSAPCFPPPPVAPPNPCGLCKRTFGQ